MNSEESATEHRSFSAIRWLFLRALAVVHLIAFFDAWPQMRSLVGADGLSPDTLRRLAAFLNFNVLGYWYHPTLAWFSESDRVFDVICVTGIVAAFLLLVNILPRPSIFVVWLCYLSITISGGEFFAFQWDNLLLETTALAFFYAPWSFRPGLGRTLYSESLPQWLLRWLLFRLFFLSAVAKIVSGDPAWSSLTALQFHYETQPLPTFVGWYLHQLPSWFHRGSTLYTLLLEGLVPFLIFASDRCRRRAFGALVVFQFLIALSGNYGFFNLLTLTLCITLLRDQDLPARLQKWIDFSVPPIANLKAKITGGSMALALVLISVEQTADQSFISGLTRPVLQLIAPFRSVNSYGLFAVMTTERDEISFEGSYDGVQWEPYHFWWKPEDPLRAPAFVEPHQPRFEWQLWFAALGTCADSPWLGAIMERLLRGRAASLGLFRNDPFPDTPPVYVRVLRRRYTFTDAKTRAATGAWWNVGEPVPFCP